MAKMLVNVQSYVQFRHTFDGSNTAAGVLREAADYLDQNKPGELLNISGGIIVAEDHPGDLYWELELYFDDHGVWAGIETEQQEERDKIEDERVRGQ